MDYLIKHKVIIEVFYLLSGPIMIIGVLIAIFQLFIIKKDISTKYKRESIKETLYIFENKIQKIESLRTTLGNAENQENIEDCNYYCANFSKTDFPEGDLWLENFLNSHETYNAAIDAMNEVELMVHYITSGIADEELAFELQGKYLLKTINNLRCYISALRDEKNKGLYEQVIVLYEKWNKKLSSTQEKNYVTSDFSGFSITYNHVKSWHESIKLILFRFMLCLSGLVLTSIISVKFEFFNLLMISLVLISLVSFSLVIYILVENPIYQSYKERDWIKITYSIVFIPFYFLMDNWASNTVNEVFPLDPALFPWTRKFIMGIFITNYIVKPILILALIMIIIKTKSWYMETWKNKETSGKNLVKTLLGILFVVTIGFCIGNANGMLNNKKIIVEYISTQSDFNSNFTCDMQDTKKSDINGVVFLPNGDVFAAIKKNNWFIFEKKHCI